MMIKCFFDYLSSNSSLSNLISFRKIIKAFHLANFQGVFFLFILEKICCKPQRNVWSMYNFYIVG
jgi:hypothetical protein